MSRLREHKRRARGDLHREMSVPALLILAGTPAAEPVPCTVRVWTKTDNHMVGDLQGLPGAANRAEPEDQIRFDLSEFPPSSLPRRLGVVSVEAGEAYRIDHLYPVDLGYQTAKVTRLDAEDMTDVPVPENE